MKLQEIEIDKQCRLFLVLNKKNLILGTIVKNVWQQMCLWVDIFSPENTGLSGRLKFCVTATIDVHLSWFKSNKIFIQKKCQIHLFMFCLFSIQM